MNVKDCRKYYDLERYLLEDVQPRFERNRRLSTFDFFCIVVWKANRAKSKISDKLLAKDEYVDLDTAVAALVSAIVSAPSAKERLRVLIEDWKFRLPMASAILAILYPSEFTVYDVRVCKSLKGRYDDVKNKSNFTTLWERYQDFLNAVRSSTPTGWSLRDKDRHLWGKSFVAQLRNDIGSNFNKSGREDAEA